MIKKILRALVSFNGTLYNLMTMSHSGIAYADPYTPQKLLSAGVDLKILGESLKDTLSKRKIVSGDELEKAYVTGLVKRSVELKLKEAMEKYGYKTKTEFFAKSNTCLIDSDKKIIKIIPTHRKNLGAFAEIDNEEDLIVDISYKAPSEEIGMALIEGLSRCTS